MPRKSPFPIKLSADERAALEHTAASYTLSYRAVVRAKLVLLAADDLPNDEIARRLDTRREVVSKWRKRFFEQRLPGLTERPRPGPRQHVAARTRRPMTQASSVEDAPFIPPETWTSSTPSPAPKGKVDSQATRRVPRWIARLKRLHEGPRDRAWTELAFADLGVDPDVYGCFKAWKADVQGVVRVIEFLQAVRSAEALRQARVLTRRQVFGVSRDPHYGKRQAAPGDVARLIQARNEVVRAIRNAIRLHAESSDVIYDTGIANAFGPMQQAVTAIQNGPVELSPYVHVPRRGRERQLLFPLKRRDRLVPVRRRDLLRKLAGILGSGISPPKASKGWATQLAKTLLACVLPEKPKVSPPTGDLP